MFSILGLRVTDLQSDLILFKWPISHLRNLFPPSSKEDEEVFVGVLLSLLHLPKTNGKLSVISILLVELFFNVAPVV